MPVFLRRVRPIHAIPVVLVLSCLTAIYFISLKLGEELAIAERAASSRDGSGDDGGGAVDSSLSMPQSFEDARDLSLRLSIHMRHHPTARLYIIILFASIYLLKQTFSIPGSVLLNVMAGFIFGPIVGVPLVAFLTATGASGCYWLSRWIGKELITGWTSFEKRIDHLRKMIEIEKTNSNLFMYLLTIRIFPFTPNWFINLASPLIGIPFHQFFFSCMFGLMPYVYVTVTAGDTLHTITRLQQSSSHSNGSVESTTPMTLSDVIDSSTIVKLILLAIGLLLPTILKRRIATTTKTNTKTMTSQQQQQQVREEKIE